jgi:hypothetical protein
MRRISAIALFTIATLAAATGLVAQEPAVKANIPFNFTVGETFMPAGEYIISRPDSHLVKIQSADRQYVALVVSSHSYDEAGATGKVVFDKYGEYYFLRHILSPTNTTLNLDIPSGKAEKRVRTQEARLQTGEKTLVAAR